MRSGFSESAVSLRFEFPPGTDDAGRSYPGRVQFFRRGFFRLIFFLRNCCRSKREGLPALQLSGHHPTGTLQGGLQTARDVCFEHLSDHWKIQTHVPGRAQINNGLKKWMEHLYPFVSHGASIDPHFWDLCCSLGSTFTSRPSQEVVRLSTAIQIRIISKGLGVVFKLFFCKKSRFLLF